MMRTGLQAIPSRISHPSCPFTSDDIEHYIIESRICRPCVYIYNAHTYIHTYRHTHIHTYTHTHIHTHRHTCMHAYIHAYIHTYIHTHIHTYTHTHIHTHRHTCMHACIHTCIHTYIHAAFVQLSLLHVYAHKSAGDKHTHIIVCIYIYNMHIYIYAYRCSCNCKAIRYLIKQIPPKIGVLSQCLAGGECACLTHQDRASQGLFRRPHGDDSWIRQPPTC